MAFAIMVSLLVSFTLTPSLCARWLKKGKQENPSLTGSTGSTISIEANQPGSHHPVDPVDPVKESLSHRLYRPIDAGYTWLLGQAMRRRWAGGCDRGG